MIPQFVFEKCVAIHPVGSRVTCDPPPLNTDEDFLVLAAHGSPIQARLIDEGWSVDGSEISDAVNRIPPEDRFVSLKLGNMNLVLTASQYFFDRFMAATSIAKRLNLLLKADRVALFQAVLYGNSCDAVEFKDAAP